MKNRIKSLMLAITMLFALTSCSNLSREEKVEVQTKLSNLKKKLIQLDTAMNAVWYYDSISNPIYLYNEGLAIGKPDYPTVVQEIVLDNVKYLVDANDYTNIIASNYLEISFEGRVNTPNYYLVIKYDDHVDKILVYDIESTYSSKLIKR